MPRFSRPLTATQLESGLWRIEKQFTYYTGEGNEKIVVQKDFVTDFFTIPWPFKMFLPKSQKGNQAAALHDWICATEMFDKKKRDKILLAAMKVRHVPKWRRKLIHTGVKWFGKLYGA